MRVTIFVMFLCIFVQLLSSTIHNHQKRFGPFSHPDWYLPYDYNYTPSIHFDPAKKVTDAHDYGYGAEAGGRAVKGRDRAMPRWKRYQALRDGGDSKGGDIDPDDGVFTPYGGKKK